ncbi:aspartate kinase [Anaeropeptidivorans aminofermentans]|jgi:aspartate kinase|uniref:aspartate kinase n=1 Tax=Anaeropeptidivorans aminofermentans TaxID=2934315 RepID=UPI002024FC9A|nr:aspartate kinase [Anaeropeptidivorans aminofermentans]MBE6013518.1 aspartate kinase [Lachnospiraceae bacterium]
MLIVQKFGGSSVANVERVMNVANRIVDTYKAGNSVVVVLSAQGDTTDELIEKAKELNKNPSRREMDMLLATGEQQSVALMAMAIHSLGYPAVSLNANQVGVLTSSNHQNARIKRINTERINSELDKNNIVIIAGFQGYNRYNDLTTLGRGGSDTTAVALAASLNADLCEIYTDVDGVYTADPRVVKGAVKLEEISYDEMLELASLGAKVLHNRSVELAKKYNVKLVVRSSMTKEEGTLVKEETKMEKMFVSGLAVDDNVARISLIGIEDSPGKAFKIFSLLAKNDIMVDIILQSLAKNNTIDISFTVTKDEAQETVKILNENKERINFNSISYDDDIAKLSIVGAGMATNPGVASVMFEALYDVGVNIHLISTSEIKITVLIDKDDANKAANSVHDKFFSQFLLSK